MFKHTVLAVLIGTISGYDLLNVGVQDKFKNTVQAQGEEIVGKTMVLIEFFPRRESLLLYRVSPLLLYKFERGIIYISSCCFSSFVAFLTNIIFTQPLLSLIEFKYILSPSFIS